ncbi:MAG: hypothetical protein NVS9B15_03400 [Acidobacteriaceae bacterium]
MFASIDDVFQFASRDTGLPIKHPVKKKLADRDEVEKYVTRRMKDDKDTQRFERSEVVLKKFGLIPHDFDLRPFLVKLMREQVAGFYDAKTKTVYLLDWLDPEAQKPVMAHELTHALQDQNFNLEKWASEKERDKAEKQGKYNRAIGMDEISTAQTAMIEGQGMITLVDYEMRGYGMSAEKNPDAVRSMAAGMEGDESSKVLKSAPMMLRESLIFPYRDGMKFVGTVLSERGKDAAFHDMFMRPPTTSHEVMVPDEYMAKRTVPSVPLPDMKRILGNDYSEYDVGAMGQFDTELLLQQISTSKATARLVGEWNGGSYFAALKKSADPKQTASINLLYVSKWQTPEAAAEFVKLYGASLASKYQNAQHSAEGEWSTEEGPVHIQQRGSTVVVAEGFPDGIQQVLARESLSGSSEPAKGLAIASGDLTLRAVPGWMRALIGAPRF